MSELLLIALLAVAITRSEIALFICVVWLVLYASDTRQKPENKARTAKQIYNDYK